MTDSDTDEDLIVGNPTIIALLEDTGQQRQLSDDEIKQKICNIYKQNYPKMVSGEIDDTFSYIKVKTDTYIYKHNLRTGRFISMSQIDSCGCNLL